ncbi:hypothetical protein [Winogradskyella aquimaris]|uniref:Carboxypeptidase regulatory-like domain-containing protein n=1 Tax=Winogradskyella aquimaris TaxID=864074 RepID=A0ABU5EIF8_9FLAO|nr:hypothetical protein [Winogradskyella aquimaris]MDY2586075.1 hypothetical protein [Winogradskyella aquimaris]
MMKKFILFLIVITLLACNSDDSNPQYCTEEYVYGLSITLRDAVDNTIVTDGLTVKASDGFYEEELMRIENSNNFFGAGEREGTYIIEITSTNYQDFTSDPILVTRTDDDCHVITEIIEFQLTPN